MAMTLITTNTESNAATSSFTSSIDSTYKLYIFKFININPATDDQHFTFQVNATDTTSYGVAVTSTMFEAHHAEDNTPAELRYETTLDQGNGTAFQAIAFQPGNGADESTSGTLWLFNPSSTTYVKHFYSRFCTYVYNDEVQDCFTSGYFNDTTAIDDIQFKMSSGNMDGVIKMYGVG
jgi:hypothetical protein